MDRRPILKFALQCRGVDLAADKDSETLAANKLNF